MHGKYCPPVAITLETNNGVIQSQEKHVAKEGMAWHGMTSSSFGLSLLLLFLQDFEWTEEKERESLKQQRGSIFMYSQPDDALLVYVSMLLIIK